MKIKKVLKPCIFILLAAQMMFASGCTLLLVGTAAGLGVAGTAWWMGSLSGNVKGTPPEVEAATLKAFQSLNIAKVSSTANSLKAEITGTTVNSDSVKVSAALQDSGETKVSIRIGTFGDRELSQSLLIAIDNNLKN